MFARWDPTTDRIRTTNQGNLQTTDVGIGFSMVELGPRGATQAKLPSAWGKWYVMTA